MPTEVLYTIPNLDTAGSGRALFNIATRLDPTKFRPSVLVERRGGRLESDFLAAGIEILTSPFMIAAKPYRSLWWRAWQTSRKLPNGPFPIWHSFNYSDDYTEPLIARLSSAKAWIYTKKNMSWSDRSWRLRSRLASGIVALNTDMLCEFFSTRAFLRKTTLIPRGVDTERFHPSRRRSDCWRDRLGIPHDALVAVTVADLVPVKGHPTLITALSSVREVHLLIAGRPLDEDYSSDLRNQVAQASLSDRVHFLGGITDVDNLLNEADIFVLPTWNRGRSEAFGVATLEAMASGLACVATATPGSRELIEDRVSGLLVPPEASEPLGAAIDTLAQDVTLRRRLGSAARLRAVEHFSIEREVAAHQDLYTRFCQAQI